MSLHEQRRAKDAIALDLVRGLAALAVVTCHVRAISLPGFGKLPLAQRSLSIDLFYGVTSLGMDAVVVFFVLSGYLVLGRIILRLGTFDARHYAIERATRIMVPLIPACAMTACVALVIGFPVSLLGTLAHAVGLNEVVVDTYAVNGPLWTLPNEIWFYVLGGAVGATVAGKRPVVALILLGIAIMVFSKLDARFLMYWLVGGMMVLFDREMRPLAVVGLPVLACGVLVYRANSDLVTGNLTGAALGETLIALGCAFTLPLLASEQSTWRLARLRGVAGGLSAISYSLYLTHFPVMLLSRFLVPPAVSSIAVGILDFAARTLLCLGVAVAFWWLFERNTGKVRALLHASPGKPDIAPDVCPVQDASI